MYYLATNEVDIFHYGELAEGATVETGQPILVYFNSLLELEDELKKYGQEYIEPIPLEDEIGPLEPPEN